jgi:hypothetical protein
LKKSWRSCAWQLARQGLRSDSSRAIAACSDTEARRGVLAKDLAGPYIAPQCRNGLVARLTHDDDLAYMISPDDRTLQIPGDIDDWGQLVEFLKKANNGGRDLTTAKLKEMNSENSVDWPERVEAGSLANVNMVLGRKDPGFEWLFRSHIKDFDRQSRPLQKWLGRLFRWSSSQKKWGRRPLKGGFAAYDEFTCKRFSFSGYEELGEFGEMCDFLCAALKGAERK